MYYKLLQLCLALGISCLLLNCEAPMESYQSFEEYPVYNGADLGLSYSPNQSSFRIWAPTASEALIHLYAEGSGSEALQTEAMQRGQQGTWKVIFNEDLKGKFYTFQVLIDGQWMNEVPDPYAKAVGVNGLRGFVLDPTTVNPRSWQKDQRPPLEQFTDIILYELHVRDLSSHSSSGIKNKGKFLGLTERGTKSPEGLSTGLDHIKELGVTHIHLLPSFDFLSVDESKLDEPQFNWGYDPQNYNVPEGSYSSNPENGALRIKEFKWLVNSLHRNGLRVIMDVVYNHTGATETSNFNQLVPGYYYRQTADGGYSNASGCGNEIASERPMVRKFIIESVLYWVNEYHIDGFRFDLMGIHDITTMNKISDTLHTIDSTIFIYGEGWTAGDSPLPEAERALKKYVHHMPGIAAFSDDLRDGVKGNVFDHKAKGFASGQPGTKESVKFGIVAAGAHPQLDYSKVNYSPAPWTKQPAQCINYVSCHDNHTLLDRLINSVPEASEAERINMHQLANAIVLTSQGVPFLHAGVELLRTKGGEENSYKSPDTVNQINWSRKAQYSEVFQYYQDLIRLRKEHPAFRMTDNDLIEKHLRFLVTTDENVIAYILSENANGDAWKNILVLFNGSRKDQVIPLPKGQWTIALDEEKYESAGIRELRGNTVQIPASTAMVCFSNQ